MAFDYAKAYQQFIDEEFAAASATAWMIDVYKRQVRSIVAYRPGDRRSGPGQSYILVYQ